MVLAVRELLTVALSLADTVPVAVSVRVCVGVPAAVGLPVLVPLFVPLVVGLCTLGVAVWEGVVVGKGVRDEDAVMVVAGVAEPVTLSEPWLGVAVREGVDVKDRVGNAVREGDAVAVTAGVPDSASALCSRSRQTAMMR